MDSVLIVSDDNFETLSEKLTSSGVSEIYSAPDFDTAKNLLLSKKIDSVIISPEKFMGTFALVADNQKELNSLKIQNQKLQDKLDEIKLVNRAKCVLIQYLNMTEQQAHRYIEKQSMDLRQSRSVTAEAILKTYET